MGLLKEYYHEEITNATIDDEEYFYWQSVIDWQEYERQLALQYHEKAQARMIYYQLAN